MSYDFEIWSVDPCRLPEGISFGGKWQLADTYSTHSTKSWQIVVNSSITVDDDEIPDEISAALPGVSYQTELLLEPTDAPEVARKLLLRVAKGLAAGSQGVAFDRQEQSILLPSGTKNFTPPKVDEIASTLMLSWWFGPEMLQETRDFINMLEIIERYIPEALPRRYGTYEPPEHKFEGSLVDLANFLGATARKSMVVWYPTKPVTNVSISLPAVWGGPDRLGFKANNLALEFDAAVLSQSGWQSQIHRLWRKMSIFLQPFYGDVRHIHGYRRHAGRLWVAADTQHHPVRSWFWRGIPSSGGVAAVIGTPYREMWKEFFEIADNIENLSYLTSNDWSIASDVFDSLTARPTDLIDPNPYFEIETYPKYWPFRRDFKR